MLLLGTTSNDGLRRTLRGLMSFKVSTNGSVFITVLVCSINHFVVGRVDMLVTGILRGQGVRADMRAFLGDLMGVLLGVMLTFTVVDGLKIRAADFTTLLTSTNITMNVTLSNGLSGFTNNLVVLIFGPFGMNSCVSKPKMDNAVGRVRVFRAVLSALSGQVVCIPGKVLDKGTIVGCDGRRVHHIR